MVEACFSAEPVYSRTPPVPHKITGSSPLPGAPHNSAVTTAVVISHDKQRGTETKAPLYNALGYHVKFSPNFSGTKADHLVHLTGLAQNRAPSPRLTSASFLSDGCSFREVLHGGKGILLAK